MAFEPIQLPRPEIPQRGFADWFEDGLERIYEEATRDKQIDV